MSESSSRAHAVRLLILTVLLRPLGNLSLAWGMKHFPQALSVDPLPYLQAFTNPYVAAGIVMLILSLLSRMALMSVADLSAILPLTAVGYILSTLLGSLVLGEHVSARQWVGTLLVFGGVAMVSSTSFRTSEPVRNLAIG